MSNNYGITTIVRGLKDALGDYLQAQYHIRDESLIRERQNLFAQAGTIAQVPFVEATPSYASDRTISQLDIPKPAKEFLEYCSTLNVGVFTKPYIHQANALEQFLGNGKDILAATGTGSGKTEIFLLNILGSLANESSFRPKGKEAFGCRALLLYPMNALVTDQLSRIRRLFGDPRVAADLEKRFGRRIRFGMYTSRTPFPGEFTAAKCKKHIQPLFEEYFLKYDNIPKIKEQLVKMGRWPCKDIHGFYNASEKKWDHRLKTQPGDTELFARHEIQLQCPDILITNYSMLEYMMLRPIERSLFQQTKEWLNTDKNNYLTLVLDEAHMYRGTGGAEVAMLIRRLMARLGISRERLRCILTSASLGKGHDAEERALRFAEELTGLKPKNPPGFYLATGHLEKLGNQTTGSLEQARALAAFDLGAFQNITENQAVAIEAVNALFRKLGLPNVSADPAKLADALYSSLPELEVTNLLVAEATANATEFALLSSRIFPSASSVEGELATQALLSLANYARSTTKNKVLLPTRLHLFFRGLQGLYACINRRCTARFDQTHDSILGHLWTAPRQFCTCGSRVYELLTHRDCGTEYLRGFVRHNTAYDFLFHEKESDVGSAETKTNHQLREIHLLVGNPPHPQANNETQSVWIEINTGQMTFDDPDDSMNYLHSRMTSDASTELHMAHSFPKRCPVCLKGWPDGRSKIMDLKTKGEQPFAALVKLQTFLQPPTRNDIVDFPNQGRKVLLFSDGRQKAARLARDIPREVEADSFREALILATKALTDIGQDPTLADQRLYLGFIDILHRHHLSYFDGADQKQLLRDLESYRRNYGADLKEALSEWVQLQPPVRFKQAVLRQLCSPYYSIPFVTAGWIAPRKKILAKFVSNLSSHGIAVTEVDAYDFICAWVAELAREFALKDFTKAIIEGAANYQRKAWGHNGKELPGSLKTILSSKGFTPIQIETIRTRLLEDFCGMPEGTGLYLLDRNQLLLQIDLTKEWHVCNLCKNLHPYAPFATCPSCGAGAPNLNRIDPNVNSYIQSRKGLWRNPILECLQGKRAPKNISAEEHTAQLSHRDAGTVLATTEQHELLFQDIIIDRTQEAPVDVLSCTTTMEVGIDIGSLVAVGLRNVPPQRENYQQRAGRSGRRGSAVSSVVTYCQGGPHDSHYFHNVSRIVRGEPRAPMIKTNNPKIARRHVHAFLIQTYFLNFPGTSAGILSSALGMTATFFSADVGQPCFHDFNCWVEKEVIHAHASVMKEIVSWLPSSIAKDLAGWTRTTAKDFVALLAKAGEEFSAEKNQQKPGEASDVEEDGPDAENKLLDFLFSKGVLPTYAFPTDLCSFNVERFNNQTYRVEIVERPQQAIAKALSEYAPGRLVVIDKKTYRCEAVTANTSSFEADRAKSLFNRTLKRYIFCQTKGCSYVREAAPDTVSVAELCPLCKAALKVGEILRPEVFLPNCGQSVDELDTDQDLTFASPAQFPIPLHEGEDKLLWNEVGPYGEKTFAEDRRLVIFNKGDPDELEGFQVCESCGRTKLYDGTPSRAHFRAYDISRKRGAARPSQQCQGNARQVYLGNEFLSDLMILRVHAKHPFETVPNPGYAAFAAMQNGMRTVAEALNLAASRILDLDPSEFSSGFRVFPTNGTAEIIGEIYLFDTLSGGAGYSSQIGEDLANVLDKNVRDILKKCNCDRSCYDCLRHYSNQFYHGELDRHLGLALLDYALTGELPPFDDWSQQIAALRPLSRMLQLSGYLVELNQSDDHNIPPLAVKGKAGEVAIGTCNGLYANSAKVLHPLMQTETGITKAHIINEYLLSRNLPAVHRGLIAELG